MYGSEDSGRQEMFVDDEIREKKAELELVKLRLAQFSQELKRKDHPSFQSYTEETRKLFRQKAYEMLEQVADEIQERLRRGESSAIITLDFVNDIKNLAKEHSPHIDDLGEYYEYFLTDLQGIIAQQSLEASGE